MLASKTPTEPLNIDRTFLRFQDTSFQDSLTAGPLTPGHFTPMYLTSKTLQPDDNLPHRLSTSLLKASDHVSWLFIKKLLRLFFVLHPTMITLFIELARNYW